jgi:hypothetical protein
MALAPMIVQETFEIVASSIATSRELPIAEQKHSCGAQVRIGGMTSI